MDTKPLERFAVQARRELLAAVDAQATAVLAPGSVTRTERGEVVKKLEAEITAHGRAYVVDKVAYTWFNRIIALRFMDARSYTDAGVVSPVRGQAHGQPEILTDAKRGNLNTDVVLNMNTAEAITGLLDGTRRSTDAEGEAYALLLTEYCHYWHKSMPFMFEREGAYTELLVPTGLLADGGFLSRSREVLTEEVCDDVEVIGWLYQFYISERKGEVFAAFKKNKKAGADEIPAATQLFTPHWIVRYLVENSLGRLWMLNRPTSRLADRMDYYIAPVDDEHDFLKVAGPEELTVIDPACGSGHMLTYAFDLLYAIYEEEGYAPSEIPGLILIHNLHGTEIDPRAASLAAFALTMKARAKQRTFLNRQIEPKICVIEPISFGPDELDILVRKGKNRDIEGVFWNQFAAADSLGSLVRPDAAATSQRARHLETLDDGGDIIKSSTLTLARRVVTQAEYLARAFGVVVANPPYMGSRNIQAELKSNLDRLYPESKSDLYSAFMARGLGLTASGGVLAMITMQSWMFLNSYELLRETLLAQGRISSMLHLGARAFDAIGGEVVSTSAFAITKAKAEAQGVFVRLVDLKSESAKSAGAQNAILAGLESPRVNYLMSADFRHFPGNIIAYWLPETRRELFVKCKALRGLADPRKGLDTGHNDRFLRCWWEVSVGRSNYRAIDSASAQASGARWFPYNKGGESRKWYGNHRFVVDWSNDGAEIRRFGTEDGGKPRSTVRNPAYYFRPSISWSDVGGLSFRFYPQGFIHDNKGPSVFSTNESTVAALLAYLNSPLAAELLSAIAPTMSTQIGDVAILPVKDGGNFVEFTEALVQRTRADWDSFEVSWNFASHPILNECSSGSLRTRVERHLEVWQRDAAEQQATEQRVNEKVAELYGVLGEISTDVPLERITLSRNARFAHGAGLSEKEYRDRSVANLAKELVSYAVGCMFGRYSLQEPGLVLADQGATLQDYLAKVPSPTFMPDADNVIPFVDDGWFEDDIVERFRQFLRTAFGAEHFEENLRFVEEALGVKTLRDYFITGTGTSKFYDDHVQRYKKRPIYWMFSSPKGSFNALIYMHRYNPSTVSTVLNEYLREYRAKLEIALTNAEQDPAAGSTKDRKNADRMRRVIAELRDYEHDVLYPLATRQLVIDLDDGVKTNYPQFYPALKKIVGLEAAE